MKILLYAVAATTVLAIWIVYRKKSTGKDAKSVELELAGADDGAGAGDFLRLISPKLDVTALTTIDLKNAGLLTLPGSIGNAVNLVKLDLGGNPELTDLPDELAHCTKLKVLFILGARKMKEVPRVLGRMTHLTRLGLKSNGIVKIADDALPPHVEHLILTDNAITEISVATFARLTKVRKLMLANNRLTALPAAGVSRMVSLELIRLANNRLASIPPELLMLPRLAWLALSGNPLSPPSPEPSVPEITDSDVIVDTHGVALGEGATGKVLSGSYDGKPVALKVFKGTVSSDGLPEDEMALYASVQHPNLIAVKALLREPYLALVMEKLLPDLKDVAMCANTDATSVRLADFGAAFTYKGAKEGSGLIAFLLERIEIRAFGVLVAEVAERIHDSQEANPVQKGANLRPDVATALKRIAADCKNRATRERPSFLAVLARIDALSK
eukprot:gene8359-31139_t